MTTAELRAESERLNALIGVPSEPPTNFRDRHKDSICGPNGCWFTDRGYVERWEAWLEASIRFRDAARADNLRETGFPWSNSQHLLVKRGSDGREL